jgi:L-arabinose transport system permease protein
MSEVTTGEKKMGSPLRWFWDKAGMLLICAVLFLGCSIFVDNFASAVNMKGLALAVTTIGLLACTMLFCLASGHFDLSVGSVVACSGVLAAVVINKTGSLFYGISAGLAMGLAVGLFNGLIIAKMKINALITTLATMQIVRGLGYIVSDGKAVGISNEGFFVLGTQQWLGIPVPVWLTIVCFIIFGLVMQNTVFGRNTLALGGNEEAARLAGINVDNLKIQIFVLQGLMGGFAGIVLASRMTSGQPMTSQGLELEVISSCVLGGVSMSGGVGNMVAVVSGVLIMGAMQNAMNLMNVEAFWQYVARGGILLAAVLFDRFKQRN